MVTALETAQADLSRVFDRANRAEYERVFSDNAGLTARQRRKFAEFFAGEGRLVGDSLVLNLLRDGAAIECVNRALGLPEDWEPYQRLEVTVKAGALSLRVQAAVIGRTGGRLVAQEEVAADSRTVVAVPLDDLALVNISRDPLPLYGAGAIRIHAQWGPTWEDEAQLHMAGNTWEPTRNNPPTAMTIEKIALIPYEHERDPAVTDRFGQRRNARFEGKVSREEDLVNAVEFEAKQIAAAAAPTGRSTYGGLKGEVSFEPGGFFRVEQDGDGRWWYVDPDGFPYWAIGFCGVRTADPALIEGKEQLFEELPDREGPLGCVYEPLIRPGPDGRRRFMPGISFYYWNVLRKYGTREAWRDRVLDRFATWGVNSIGNWSTDLMVEQRRVPHTRALMARLDDTPKVSRTMPDAFATQWPRLLDEEIAKAVAPQKDNPWLIGYFCDNELPWGGLHKGEIFSCEPDSPLRDEFVRFARSRYHEIAAFNADFGSAFGTWEEAGNIAPHQVPQGGGAVEAMHEFVGIFAEKYFSTVASTIKAHDPNHLYLGCRFVRNNIDHRIVAAAGRYCDVVTVNCYDLWPREEQFSLWHRQCNRPIQIGEYAIPALRPGVVRAPFPEFSPATIERLTKEMGEKWARQPWSLGFHWYTHLGAVGQTDQPRDYMVRAFRHIADGVARWRGLDRNSYPGLSTATETQRHRGLK